MTNVIQYRCNSHCNHQGSVFYGLYLDECHCFSSEPGSSNIKSHSDCSEDCSGDSSFKCGAYFYNAQYQNYYERLSSYKIDSQTSTITTTSTTTTTTTTMNVTPTSLFHCDIILLYCPLKGCYQPPSEARGLRYLEYQFVTN